MLIYLIFLIISQIIVIFSFLCEEGKNNCFLCNPMKSLCLKCDKEIYIPDGQGGCMYNNKYCILQKNYCLECNEEKNLCKKCENDYFPDEYGGCSYTNNCKISQIGQCLKCKDDYILIGLDGGYYREALKICKSLNSDDLQNCEEIEVSNGSCLSCKNGFYLNKGDNKCIKTPNCEESFYGVCKKCIKYYYLDKNDNKCKEQRDIFSSIIFMQVLCQ